MKFNDESIEKWDEEKKILLENNKEWLETVKCTPPFPDDLNEQIKNLSLEVIKWHELSKQSYTLLSALYENMMPLLFAMDGVSIDLKSNLFFNDIEERFEKAKNNYMNNIKSKEDPYYRPDISI
jgi:hypothetical protein